jgi:transcriptional regulator with PAS, ATPase and Fis domain
MGRDEVAAEVRALLDGYKDPAILLDERYRIIAANRVYRDYYAALDVVGKRCFEVSHRNTVPCDQAGEICPLQSCKLTGTPQRVLHIHHNPVGAEYVDVEIHPLTDDEGRLLYCLEILRPTRVASALPADHGMVGCSSAFHRMLELLQRVASSEAVALLLGESGTGKELVAQAIHDQSGRRDGMFVPVECSGLTESLFESELFGHEKGAFTGAYGRRRGLVEAASNGTLFLDEVGDIPLHLQVKLLRLLETGTFRRVGSVEPTQANFRLICATHRDLQQMVREGSFREDLYYRISVFPIPLPPLRERIDDLPMLAESLLRRISRERHLQLSKAALDCLSRYDFPGNIRELRNILERASLMADGDAILPRHLAGLCDARSLPGEIDESGAETILPLAEVERRYLRRVLARHPVDRGELARRLGISERTLFRKLKRLRNVDENDRQGSGE